MKTQWMLGAAIWLIATWVRGAEGGIPYRLLWHAYQLGIHSANQEERMAVHSTGNVDPTTFVFTPKDRAGQPALTCDKTGFGAMRWVPEFYQSNQLIYSNQPKGSLKLSFGWSFSFNSRLPLGYNLILHGRNYAESVYHGLLLSHAMSGR